MAVPAVTSSAELAHDHLVIGNLKWQSLEIKFIS